MAFLINKLISFALIFIIGLAGFGSALRIVTEPQPYNDMTEELNISCIADGPAYWAKSIVSIQIMKQIESKTIAVIDLRQEVNMGAGSKGNMKAEGHVDTDASKSYLTLIIDKPDRQDAGIYRCLVFYTEEDFQIVQEDVKGNVTFQAPIIIDIVTDLVGKVSTLMAAVREQGDLDSMQKENIQRLEKQIKDSNAKLNKTIKTQEKQRATLNDALFVQKQDIDILADKINEQKQQIDNLRTNHSVQKQQMDRQNKQIDDLNNNHSVQKQEIDALKNDNIKKQQQLDTLMDFIKQQNQTIHTLQIQLQNLNKRVPISSTPTATTTTPLTTTITSTTITTPTIAPTSTTTACLDKEWTYYKGDQTCLRVFGKEDPSKRLSWSKARESCQTFGGDLVQIRDNTKNTFVSNLYAGSPIGFPWIGVKNHATISYDFKYVDGSALGTYHPWRIGNPRGDEDGDRKCVFMFSAGHHTSGQWADYNCTKPDAYVCSTSLHVI